MSRDDLAAAAAAEIDRWEQALVDELLRLFDRQEGVVLARLQGTKARKHTRHWEPAGERKIDPKYIADPARWLLEAAAVAAPLLTRIFTSVYSRLSKRLRAAAPADATPAEPGQGDPEGGDKRMLAAIEERVELVARGVDTARVEVEKFIAAQEDAGGTMSEIVENVREFYRTRKPVWASRIAVVSAVGSINSSSLMAATDAGSSAKQWISRRDASVRDTHVKADGQVRLLDEEFRLGGIPTHPKRSRLMFPGDPSDKVPLDEIMNCRCTMVFSPPKRAEKALVRTAAGARQYGQPIGSVIVPDVIPAFSAGAGPSAAPSRAPRPARAAAPSRPRRSSVKVDGRSAVYASDDAALVAMIRQHSPALVLEDGRFEVLAVRDERGRVGGYVAWQTADGADGPKGTVLTVSVHPALKGRRIGDQLTAAAVAEDADVVPARAPRAARPSGSTARAPRSSTPAASRPARAASTAAASATGASTGRATVPDLSKPGDTPGTSGDFAADAKRIERLQRAYAQFATTSLFSRGGRFTREREKQQQAIIDHFLGAPGVKAERKALVLGGLPGAGKTTTLNSAAGQTALGIDLGDYVTVNADEVKSEMIRRGMVPTYPGLSPDEAGTLFHTESFEVAHSLMRQAAAKGLNFVYDTSLKSTGQFGFVTSASGRTAPPPYRVTAVLVDVPVSAAKDRAKARYLAGDRYMPLSLIDSMKAYGGNGRSSLPAQNFDQIKKNAHAWYAFDNSGADAVLTGQGGGRRGTRSP